MRARLNAPRRHIETRLAAKPITTPRDPCRLSRAMVAFPTVGPPVTRPSIPDFPDVYCADQMTWIVPSIVPKATVLAPVGDAGEI